MLTTSLTQILTRRLLCFLITGKNSQGKTHREKFAGYKQIFLLLSFLLLAVLQACKESPSSTPEINEKKSNQAFHNLTESQHIQLQEINGALEKMAQSFARLVAQPDMRASLKNEAGKQFDGDYEVLFKTLINLKTKSDKSVRLALAESYRLTNAGKPMQSNSEQEILQIASKIPRFHLAVPRSVFDSWNESTVPLVAYKPVGVRDQDLTEVKAFDANGNLIRIDVRKWNGIKQPLIILGVNERTDDSGNLLPGLISGRSGKFVGSPDKRGKIRLMIDEELPPDGGGGGLPPSPTLSRFLYVKEFKCNDPWWDPFESDPEFFVEVNGVRTDFYEINGYETRQYGFSKIVYSSTNDQSLFITVREQDWWVFFTSADDVALNWHYPGNTASVNGFIFSSLVNPVRILDNTGTVDQVELVIQSNF